MPKPQPLSDQELFALTSAFQADDYRKDSALELVAAATLSMLIEPGDRMAGALVRTIGLVDLLGLLIDGLQTKSVIEALGHDDLVEDLRQNFGDLESTLADSRQRWLPRLSKSSLTDLFAQSKALGLTLVTSSDEFWPHGLNDLQDSAPVMLFVEGRVRELGNLSNAVSIVGSRSCTNYGLQVTNQLVSKLAAVQRPTVSGGAIGIDASAHQKSIVNGLATVAVMAGGLDRKYPRSNFALFEQIRQLGVLVSELPPGVSPTRWRFLQRNRLIAALTPTTVIVEAGHRSGSIRTANNALELDRDLYAVPGPVTSNTSAGTNLLICQGKALTLCDLDLFASGNSFPAQSEMESAEAKRASDAIREIGYPTKKQISKVAGLTEAELGRALYELKSLNHIIENRGLDGQVYYALNHA